MPPEPKYVLWGLPQDSTDPIDKKVLLSEATQLQCDRVRLLAIADGWHMFRQVLLDDTPPDFVACISKTMHPAR